MFLSHELKQKLPLRERDHQQFRKWKEEQKSTPPQTVYAPSKTSTHFLTCRETGDWNIKIVLANITASSSLADCGQ
ncbi:hypothetical protein RRG08_027011 [Elysia crispata]|uniref:Uncharacterized protein n=1 Tax=Elysia crispata TaxID=231223 RepID=A0AAE1AK79_9GAST|nr:hypothetical protein RRG08_027011 [Elysia crispata]